LLLVRVLRHAQPGHSRCFTLVVVTSTSASVVVCVTLAADNQAGALAAALVTLGALHCSLTRLNCPGCSKCALKASRVKGAVLLKGPSANLLPERLPAV
jgi:hypothetical protein